MLSQRSSQGRGAGRWSRSQPGRPRQLTASWTRRKNSACVLPAVSLPPCPRKQTGEEPPLSKEDTAGESGELIGAVDAIGEGVGGGLLSHRPPQSLLFNLPTGPAPRAPPWEPEMRGPCPCSGWDNLLATKLGGGFRKTRESPEPEQGSLSGLNFAPGSTFTGKEAGHGSCHPRRLSPKHLC